MTEKALPFPEERVLHTPIDDDYYIKWDEIVGYGAQCSIYVCVSRKTNMRRALKLRPFGSNMQNEVATWIACMEHKNILQIIDLYDCELNVPAASDNSLSAMHGNSNNSSDKIMIKQRTICIVMELATGDLFDIVANNRGRLAENVVAVYISQLAAAIAHMHSLDMCHRDIKLENIMIRDVSTMTICLGDFGFAVSGVCMKPACTYAYAAPEILKSIKYSRLTGTCLPFGNICDEWAMGVCLYIMLCGYHPFGVSDQTLTDKMHYKIITSSYTIPLNLQISPEARSLVASLLTVEPRHRITAEQVLLHPWITQHTS